MAKLIEKTTNEILQAFQDQYYKDYGRYMAIGSEEFNISSTFSYCLGTLIQGMNKEADNTFIDTAQGIWLDRIASSFGLSRVKPAPYNARFIVSGTGLPQNLTVSGVEYRLKEAISGALVVRWYQADTPLDRPSLSLDALDEIVKAAAPSARVLTIEFPEGLYADSDGNPVTFPYTGEGDNRFREYIKRHNGVIPGTVRYWQNMLTDLTPYINGFFVYENKVRLSVDDRANAPYQMVVFEDFYKGVIADNRILGYDIMGSQVVYPPLKVPNEFLIVAEYSKSYQTTNPDESDAITHYKLVNAFYQWKCVRDNKDYNQSEISALLLKPIEGIDGLREWFQMIPYPDITEEQYQRAIGIKAELAYCTDFDYNPLSDRTWSLTQGGYVRSFAWGAIFSIDHYDVIRYR